MKDNNYYPELDGLRFLAFFAVFLHHGPAISWIPAYDLFLSNGWVGVDLFLCLSAFLFVHLLRKEWERTGTINIAFFYFRRSLRIWPIYYIFTSAIVMVMILMGDFSNLNLLRAYGLWTFTDNILTIHYNYNTLAWTAHLWTISYEEQFYAVIPWFLRFMFKHTKEKQILILGIIFLAGSILRAGFIIMKVPHPAIWVLPITHFESIMFGLCVGLGVFDTIFKKIPAWLTALAGISALYFSTKIGSVYITNWWLMLLYPVVGLSVALLVHSTLRTESRFITKTLGWKPVAFLGKISYGLYLLHMLTIQLVTQFVVQSFSGISIYKQDCLIFVVSLGLTVSISTISYILIEKPFLRMKSRFTIVESRPV